MFSNTEHLPRNAFTALASQSGINDRALHIAGLISSLYEREYSHISQEIKRHQDIHPIHIEQLEWDMVIDASYKLLNQYYSECLILMLPLDQGSFFEYTIPEFRIETDEAERQIVEIRRDHHSPPIKLIVVRLRDSQTNAFLFSPVSIQWTTIVSPTTVLMNCPRDEARLHLSANGVFACKIIAPRNIVWFEFATIDRTNALDIYMP